VTPAFTAPPELTVRELASRLAPLGRLVPAAAQTRRSAYLDTFDWVLHREGLILEEVRGGGAPRLLLRHVDGGGHVLGARGAAPRFARELPPGPLRDRLAPLTEPRALLTLAAVETTTEPCALLDAAGRSLARLSLERATVAPPGEEAATPLPPRVDVLGGRRAGAVAAGLAALPGLSPAPADALAAILAPLGRVPEDYSGRVRVPLEPGQPAGDAARAVLASLLTTVERNVPGARADVDPEFLHDLRVAVRRARTLLGQMRSALPPTARLAAELRWVQEVTGPARDLDVYVLELPALGALLPGGPRRSLGPLARLLARRRAEAHAGLAAELDGPRFARALGLWRGLLAPPSARRLRGAPLAARPVHDAAAARIRKLFRRALREGGAVTPASPAADLHELRKTCKKLRYLLEFFQPVLDRDEVAHFVAALKALQENLGRHQDLQVQARELLGFARQLARDRSARPPAFLAMGMLVERLREEQQAERVAFAGRFAEFARRQNRRRLRTLLTPRPAPPPSGDRTGAAPTEPPPAGDGI
jgi:CHAD domain-containing protein